MTLNFSQFLTALTQKVLQGVKKSFEYVHWDIKIYWILPDTLWNSTTVTMLMIVLHIISYSITTYTYKLQATFFVETMPYFLIIDVNSACTCTLVLNFHSTAKDIVVTRKYRLREYILGVTTREVMFSIDCIYIARLRLLLQQSDRAFGTLTIWF